MESKNSGAKNERRERWIAETKAYFAEIRKRLIESGAKPLTREQFQAQVAAAIERRRREREQQDSNDTDKPAA